MLDFILSIKVVILSFDFLNISSKNDGNCFIKIENNLPLLKGSL